MMRKKRGYKRESPIELVRDYKLFAIACEGGKREPDYFKLFRFLSKKIAVDIIEDVVSEDEALTLNPNKSAPKWVLDRAIKYIEKEGLSDEDELWFVMDIDRWSVAQLREISSYCDQFPNWNIVLSNPCFEVWLYFHKKSDINLSSSISCNDFKNEISTFEKGGYHPLKFLPLLPIAIANAKNADADKNYFFPNLKVSKVYQLGESVIKIIGQKGFDDFIEQTLPILIQQENEKIKNSKRRRK
jgi:hypothetical protein